jgi:hypothetical protein
MALAVPHMLVMEVLEVLAVVAAPVLLLELLVEVASMLVTMVVPAILVVLLVLILAVVVVVVPKSRMVVLVAVALSLLPYHPATRSINHIKILNIYYSIIRMIKVKIPMVTQCQLCSNKVLVHTENRLNNSICSKCFNDDTMTATKQEVDNEHVDRSSLTEFHYRKCIVYSRDELNDALDDKVDVPTTEQYQCLRESKNYYKSTEEERTALITTVCAIFGKDAVEVLTDKVVHAFLVYGMHMYHNDQAFLEWIRDTF